MCKWLIILVSILASGLTGAQEVDKILMKADALLDEKEYEQSRYYLSIAQRLDSSGVVNYDRRYFLVDSTFIFDHADSLFYWEARQISAGDAAYFKDLNKEAMHVYASLEDELPGYIQYRMRMMFERFPETKKQWIALLSKRIKDTNVLEVEPVKIKPDFRGKVKIERDSLSADTLKTQGIPNYYDPFTGSDSIRYEMLYMQALEEKAYNVAKKLTIEAIQKYGSKALFDAHLADLHHLQNNQSRSTTNSARLAIEHIERIEKSKPVDKVKITEILDKQDLENIDDPGVRKKIEKLKKKYAE